MIMPCMNSTSACDRGGSLARVEGGSILLGLPGAPGCTTTGGAGSVCCARITEERNPGKKKKTAAMLAPASSRIRAPDRTRRAALNTALNIICASLADTVRSALRVENVPIPRYRYDRYRYDAESSRTEQA